jgi:predicted kinase
MTIELPDFSLIVLMGASGSGKSRFAARPFFADRGAVSPTISARLSATTRPARRRRRTPFDALHHLLRYGSSAAN